MKVEDTWVRRDTEGRKRRTDRYGTSLRWRARWRDTDGRQRAKSFRTRDAAEAHLAGLDLRQPANSGRTVGEWLTVWWSTKQRLGPMTVADYESIYATHVQPRWGQVPLEDVRHSDVLAWASGLVLSPSRANRAVMVLSQALELAVRDGVLPANPAAKVRVKPGQKRLARPLDQEQRAALLDAAGRHRPLVHLAMTTGLRWGELAGLKVGAVDLRGRRVTVHRTLSTLGGALVAQERTKGGKVRRVALTRAVVEDLRPLTVGRGQDELLFVTSRGNGWRHSSWEREWEAIKARAGVPTGFWFHDLRHTAASLAIRTGADVKQVQAMLGHASAAMTLDVYGHMFGDTGKDLADRIGEAL